MKLSTFALCSCAIAVLSLTFVINEVNAAAGDCTFGGQNFDTQGKINGKTGTAPNQASYDLNFCQPFSCGGDANADVCQTRGSNIDPIGDVGAGTWNALSNGVQYVTGASTNPCGAAGGVSVPRLAEINFICNPTAPSPPTAMVADDTSKISLDNPPFQCTFVFTIQSQEACKVVIPSSGGSKGLSGGWVFIIILIVVTFVYIFAGAAYMRFRKGATGTDMCPNKEFWKDLPSLIKDGFSFVFSKCRGGGKSGESYNNI